MDVARPSNLRRLLQEYAIVPRRRWGQNFLVDRRVVERILATIDPQPGESLVEIGPGAGVLTRELARAGSQVLALDIDQRFAPLLAAVLGLEAGRVTFVQGDALRYDFVAHLPMKLVGNLPYYLTSPLLFRLLKTREVPDRMVFMVQLEVAERILAPPGGKDYGVLSVLCGYRTQARRIIKVPPSAFWPAPEVHSAVVELRPRGNQCLVPHLETRLFQVVEAAFAQRRKTLGNSLKQLELPRERLARGLALAGIDPGWRGERLDVDDYCRLTRCLFGE